LRNCSITKISHPQNTDIVVSKTARKTHLESNHKDKWFLWRFITAKVLQRQD